MEPTGVPARELSDDELERQGAQAHATRNWVFLHGTAEQFRHHTERMLELEQEYLRRHPKRTWQGVAAEAGTAAAPSAGAVEDLLRAVDAAGGRMHRLELHQAARAAGVPRAEVAALYRAEPALLAVDGHDRLLTDAGRARLG